MKIEITHGTNLNGKLLKPGDVVDAGKSEAALLIGQNQAKPYVAQPERPKLEPDKNQGKGNTHPMR